MRILLATDGSEDSKRATAWLARLPLPQAAEVMVLSVASLGVLTIENAPLGDLRAEILAGARRVAEEARQALAARWPDAATRVAQGDAREEIVAAAEAWGADLVVVGARGLGAVTGFLLGSVSLAVARQTPGAVLVVKGEPRPLRRALAAIDGSEHALAALRYLASLPLEPRSRVLLLGVVEPLHLPASAPAAVRKRLRAALDDLRRERRAGAQSALGRAAQELAGRDIAVETAVRDGLPAEEIVRAASAGDVDLVVLGARGLGTVRRLLLGSVSAKVVRTAPCPVLIVKARPAAPVSARGA